MINTVSCMPLHVSVSMGLKILNIIEKQRVIVDYKIKEDKGQQTPELTNIMSRLNNLSSAQYAVSTNQLVASSRHLKKS